MDDQLRHQQMPMLCFVFDSNKKSSFCQPVQICKFHTKSTPKTQTLCHYQRTPFFSPQNIIQTVSKPVPAPSLCMCAHFTAWRALCICPQTLLLISLFHFFLRSLTNPANKCLSRFLHLTTPTTTTTTTNSNSSPHQTSPPQL